MRSLLLRSLLVGAPWVVPGAACLAQETWTVRGEDGAEKTVQEHADGDWQVPPVPARGSCRRDRAVERTTSLEMDLEFTLGEDAPSKLAIAFESEDGRRPWLALQVRFDPMSGGAWTFRMQPADQDPVRLELEEPAEPDGLQYHLHVRLPAEGGCVLELNGRPLVFTPLGRWPAASLVLMREGSVHRIRVRGPVPQDGALDAGLVEAARQAPAEPASWWTTLLAEPARRPLREDPPGAPHSPGQDSPGPVVAMGVRMAGTLDFPGGQVDRLVLEARPRLDIPALRFRPTSAPPWPTVLLLADRPAGKTDTEVIAAACALARQGVLCLVPDLIARGERREFQEHDGPYHLSTLIWGPSFEALRLDEARRWLATLRGFEGVGGRSLVVGTGASAGTALELARQDPALECVVVDPAGLDVDRLRASIPSPGNRPRRSLAECAPAMFTSESFESRLGELGPRATRTTMDRTATAILERLGKEIPASPAAVVEPDALLLGHLEVGSLWYSWILDEVLRSADRTVVEATVELPTRLRAVLGLDTDQATARPITGSGEDVQVWQTAPGARVHVARVSSRAAAGDADGLLPADCRHVTLAIGDLGKLAAIQLARRHLPERDAEVWLGLDPRGTGPEALALVEHALVAAAQGRPLLGQWVEDVLAMLARIRAEAPEADVRLFGAGAGGLAALAAAVLAPGSVGSVTGCEAVPSLRTLIGGDPKFWSWRAPPEEFITAPSPVWFAPDLARECEIEDLVLALADRDVAVSWLDPVDRFRQPLSRRDRHAMWPRVQHRTWSAPR